MEIEETFDINSVMPVTSVNFSFTHTWTSTLVVVKHLVNKDHAQCHHQKEEAAECYGDDLDSSQEILCGEEGTRPVKYETS